MYRCRVANRVVLHVGAPKTGTTFLQGVLFQNRERLRALGVLVPGVSRREHGKAATGVRKGPASSKYADWERLVAQTHSWPKTVVISNEWFSMAPSEHARLALEDLGNTEKHIVFTARDFIDQVPSAWQETLKLGVSSTLEGFIKSLDAADSGGEVLPDVAVMRDRWRWSVFDPAEVLDRWAADLPPDRLHVVTVPPRGADPNLLWRRFAGLLGIDPDACETKVDQTRQSVGVESARLLQEIGPVLRSAVGADKGIGHEAFPWVRQYFSQELLVPRGGRPIAMRQSEFAMIRERSHQSVQRVRAAGYDVVGDLLDLSSSAAAPGARHPDGVTDRELLELAMPLLGDLLRRVREEYLRAEEAERKATAVEPIAHRGQRGAQKRQRRPRGIWLV